MGGKGEEVNVDGAWRVGTERGYGGAEGEGEGDLESVVSMTVM